MKQFQRGFKSIAVCLIVLIGFVFVGCGKKEDVITELSYAEYVYKMAYDYFDGEETYQFNISADESLYVKVECLEGSLEVKVVNIDNEELYKEELLVSKDATVKIPEDGRYIVILTGKETAGSIYMEVVDDE